MSRLTPSTVTVGEVNAPAVARYKEMRAELMQAPSDERELYEIVVTSQLALLGQETAFKLHAIRLFEMKISKERLQQVILAGLGVTFVIPQAAQVLEWIAQAYDQYSRTNEERTGIPR
ncbi:hypothetical protein [Cupriavidus pinatubonensis]|uniref:hypothetical protein n=1 Tax=Cupriavidus pinatubonensis TaxID=248026 RepID=UPI00112DDB6E|nr:hypothetical protein [Cupriavidus pinatubonensis]TPQ26626.1 hypothetical protein C2U69_34740 [Cupriavidus pinatubonensis]